MKKTTIHLGIVALLVLVAYNFAAFMIPWPKAATFWISWAYSLLSFGVAGYTVYTAIILKKDTKSRFYGFPIARIGVVYWVAQIVVGMVFMALDEIIVWWIPTVLFTIGLAVVAFGIVGAEIVVEEIEKQDVKLKRDVTLMRGLQSKVNQLAVQSENAALKALAEEFRYSDPVSTDAIAEAEADLAAAVDELQNAYVDGDNDAVAQLCRKTSAILAERNRLCKLNKN